jgi:hypothetical protein
MVTVVMGQLRSVATVKWVRVATMPVCSSVYSLLDFHVSMSHLHTAGFRKKRGKKKKASITGNEYINIFVTSCSYSIQSKTQ